MRRFAIAALGLISLASPALLHASMSSSSQDDIHVYLRAEDATPGEPPTAILVMTGLAGAGMLMLRRKRIPAQ